MTPYYLDGQCALYTGDCRRLLRPFGAARVDLVLTDPPYNTGQSYGAPSDALPPAVYQRWLRGVLRQCARATRDGVVFFPGLVNLLTVPTLLRGTGLRVVRTLGWHRREFAGDKWCGGPALSWEPVIWASAAERPFWNRRYGVWGRDFLVVPSTRTDPYRRAHPCPKPLAVMRWLVGLFCPPGGILLDPFAGTGTTLRAAKDLGCHAVGFEQEERFCAVAAARLAQGVLPLGDAS